MIEARRRLVSNVGGNLVALGVGAAVGLWQTPYLIRHLGVGAFGQIGVLRAVADYGSLITFSLMWTVHRFVAIRLDRDDTRGTNEIFNTALVSMGVLCGLVMTVAFAISARVPALFHAVSGSDSDISRLFLALMLTSCVVSMGSPYLSVPLARHRFDLINVVRILGFAVQVAVIVACFTTLSARLAFVGWAYVLKETFILAGVIWVAMRLAPGMVTRPAMFRWRAFRDMAVMTGWAVLDRVGFLLYYSIDLLLINAFLGSVACGRYAPITQLGFMLNMLVVAVANVFWPIACEHIAKGSIDSLAQYAVRTTRFMGVILALPVGLLCGLSRPLLRTWLGADWAPYAPLLIVLVVPLAVTFALRHLFSITHGMNRVRAPALATVAGGILNLALSATLLKFTNLGLYGVALATVLSLVLKDLLFMVAYCARVLSRPAASFYRALLPGALLTAGLVLAGLGLSKVADVSGLVRLAAAGSALCAVYAVAAAALLGKDELRFLRSLLPRRRDA